MDENKYGTTTSAFTDVKEGAWYVQAIQYMASIQVLNGYEDGTFRPNEEITRAEFAQIASLFDTLLSSRSPFVDVPDGYWAKTVIDSDYAKGWIYGYEDNTFRPNHPITRAEAVAVVNRMLERTPTATENVRLPMGIFVDVPGSNWAYSDFVEATLKK